MIDGQKLWLCDLLSGKSCKEMERYLLDKSLVDRIERYFSKFVVLGANVHLNDLWNTAPGNQKTRYACCNLEQYLDSDNGQFKV